MSVRTDKVNSLLKKEISWHLLQEEYEGIEGMLTITGVDTAPDLMSAKVFFSVVGQDETEALKVLERNIYDIQGYLNRRLVIRRVPKIKFVVDESGKYAEHVNSLIKQIKKHD